MRHIEIAKVITKESSVAKSKGSEVAKEANSRAVDAAIGSHGKGNKPGANLFENGVVAQPGIRTELSGSVNHRRIRNRYGRRDGQMDDKYVNDIPAGHRCSQGRSLDAVPQTGIDHAAVDAHTKPPT